MKDNIVMRQKFNRGIETLVARKWADNSAFITIDAVKVRKEVLQTKGAKKTVKEY